MIRRILQAVLAQVDRRITEFANLTDQPATPPRPACHCEPGYECVDCARRRLSRRREGQR